MENIDYALILIVSAGEWDERGRIVIEYGWIDDFGADFIREIRTEYDWKGTDGDLLTLYGTGRLENIVLLVIWACILIEMGVTVYKTVRYGKEQ